MHRDRRLTMFAAALMCALGAACERQGADGASEQRRGDTTTASAGACAPNGRVPPVTSGGIGVARIGMSVSEVRQSCPTRDTTFSLGEGMQEQGAVIEFAGHRILALTTGGTTIQRLIVADSSFRTERGLGVGSTVGQLREAYGRLCGAVGEGTVAVWLAGLPNVSFGLDTRLSELPASGSRLSDDPSVIPDTARVTSLWIISEGVACGGS
ncbi:MAG: hypothetical protein M3125_02020 [Gemmatimonadota bacterium]|nr:hypothetical protein [Gemmatimonadota bacterium]